MAEEFTMPKLGLTMTDGTIREWLVEDGAYVQAGEPILVIETDKVETEVEARADGVLRLAGVVGSTYECGAVIGYLLDEGAVEDMPDPAEAVHSATPGLMAIPEIEEPTLDLFANDTAAADDDVHLSDEAIAAALDEEPPQSADERPESSVVEVVPPEEPPAPVQTMEESLPELPDDVVAAPLVAPAVDTDAADVDPVDMPVADVAARGAGGRILASPRARATAYEAELSLATVSGSGPGGRIVHDDVVAAIAARAAAERAEADRRHAERLEAARQAEAERLEAERLEAERLEAERLEAERLEAERLEAERLEAERLEAERLEAERLEVERAAAEQAELERLERERLERERLSAAAAEADRLAALPPPPTEPQPVDAAPAVEEPKDRPLTRAATLAQSSADASLPALEPTPLAGAAAAAPVAATGGARLLADFLGIDLGAVRPSSGGRITREDVGAWVRHRLAASPAESAGEATDSAPDAATPDAPATKPAAFAPLLQEPAETIPLQGMRGLIAQRMHASLNDMAQLTLSVDVDMAGVNAERERRRGQGQQVPGYTAWVVSAAAQAIEEHNYINSQITADGVAVLPDVHVGVAVALDEGLIVPVIEHANLRTVEETHAVVADLAGRARVGKLKFEELEGATFSVTALGMYGVDMFTPVINPPNTAILGVGRLRSETGWSDGRPVEKTVMTLSLTWDHRAFDGAPAAEFAQTIVRLLQSPTELV